MATYGDMQARIARELHRTDLASDIKSHILSAIVFYGSERFDGNENRWTLTTVANTNYYTTTTASPGTLPTGIDEIDSITTTVGNRTYTLQKTSFSYMNEIDAGVTNLKGYPRLWAWFQDQLRIYPTPNAGYLLTIFGQTDLTALANDTDSNFWTNDAEQLIRARAKKTLALDVTYDDSTAKAQDLLEKEARLNLKAQANKLISSGRIRSTSF